MYTSPSGSQELSNIQRLASETLINVFKYVAVKPRDLVILSLVSRRFRELSHSPEVYKSLERLIPSYIKEEKESAIRRLSIWKKIELAYKIENNLVKGTLHSVFKTTIVSPTYVHKIIIGNYFIYATKDALGFYDMQSGKEKKFAEHKIRGLQAIYADKQFLVSFYKKEFKIWALDCPEESIPIEQHIKIAPCYSDAGLLENKGDGYPSPVADTRDHLFAVASEDHVMVMDCRDWSILEITFESARQVEFTDNYLMLVSDKDLQIYELPFKVKEATSPLPSFSYSSNNPIYRAKIHQDRIIIAYENINRVSLEVGKSIGAKSITKLFHPSNPKSLARISSIDIFCGKIFVSSFSLLCRWNPNQSQPTAVRKKNKNYESSALQVLGKHIFLNNSKGGFEICDRKFNPVAIYDEEGFYFGKPKAGYLIAEKVTELNVIKIFIFDLKY